MNNRPIHTLEEDFARLGLLDEMDAPGAAQPDPAQQRKQRALGRKQKALDKAKAKVGMQPQQADIDFEGDDIEEMRLVRKRRIRGIKKIKARKAAKRYYQQHRARIARMKKTVKAKRRRHKLAKMPKARRGFIRRMESTGLGNLGGVVSALGQPFNTAELQQTYSNLRRLGHSAAEGFGEIMDEGFVSSIVDFGLMQEAAVGIANEATMFAQALAEHEDHLTVADQNLMQEHVDRLIEELDRIVTVMLETKDVCGLTEDEDDLDDDFDFEDDDLEEMEYGESPMPMVHGYGNEPDESTFSVMNPLGIQKVGSREKLILAKQLPRESTEDEEFDGDDLGEHYWDLP